MVGSAITGSAITGSAITSLCTVDARQFIGSWVCAANEKGGTLAPNQFLSMLWTAKLVQKLSLQYVYAEFLILSTSTINEYQQ